MKTRLAQSSALPAPGSEKSAFKARLAEHAKTTPDDSNLLPIRDESFTKCSSILHQLTHEHHHRSAAPSELLPPLP